jgi:amino acid adenylation domain
MSTIAYKLSPQQNTLLATGNENTSCFLRFFVDRVTDVELIKSTIVDIAAKYLAFKLSFVKENNELLQSVNYQPQLKFHDTGMYVGFLEAVSVSAPVIQVYIHKEASGCNIAFVGNPVCVDISSLLLLQHQVVLSLNGDDTAFEEEIDYAQFSAWQHQLLDEDVAIEARHFWLQQANTTAVVTRLEHLSSGERSYKSASKLISQDISKAIAEKASLLNISAETMLLSAYIRCITKISTVDDFNIGLECHGREFDELSNTMGMLSKLVPFLVNSENSSDVLAVAELVEHAKSYQFHYLKSDHKFDYHFSFLKANGNFTEAAQMLQPFKLKCQIVGMGDSFRLSFIYDERSFSADTVNYLLDSFLHNVCEQLKLPAQHTRYLAGIIYEGKQANMVDVDIVNSFKNIVKAYPANIAIKTLANTYTYQQLDQLSDNIAKQLRADYNVAEGDFVGLLTESTEWMVIGMLAILKAGGAYLPLDVDMPSNRLSGIIDDAKPACILTNAAFVAQLQDSGARVAIVEVLQNTFAGELEALQLSADAPVYLIYTSGTTGKPKGMVVTARNLLNYVGWLKAEFDINAKDSSILQSSYAYDLGYTSLWGCLLSGATLHVVSPEQRSDADWMVNYIVDNNLTYLKLTPSVFYLLLQASNLSHFSKSELHYIFLGGEKINVKMLQQFVSLKPDTVFVNHYGPTETTIGTIFHKIPSDSLESFSRKPVIGTPISGNKVLIRNVDGEICLPGELGEICIGGIGVAKGYYNRDELNVEKFVEYADPVQSFRLYKTGDLGYSLPDGRIVIEGRNDNQVKVRGHRIELGELQNALHKTGLDHLVLKLVESSGFGQELVCYYKADQEIDVSQLRTALMALVPEYMIPSFFVRIKNIPLTANGKVDMSALPDPYSVSATINDRPMNAAEQQIADIWSSVLKLQVGATTDFFVAGGDSIKAIQIISKMNKQGLKCQLADIFNHTTVQGLAAHITGIEVDAVQLPVANVPESTVLYRLTPMQELMLFHARVYPDSKANNIVRQFDISGTVNVDALKYSVGQAFGYYDMLKVQFVSVEDGERLKIRSSIEIDRVFILVDLSTSDSAELEVAHHKTEWVNQGFDLDADVLFRVKLLRLKDKHILLLNYHHIIMDGWCLNIVLKEIMSCYASRCTGSSYEFSPYTSFVKYLDWIDALSSSDAQAFWKDYLKDYASIATVPVVYDTVDEYKPEVSTYFLDEEMSAKLQDFCSAKRITVNQFLQTAWAVVLGKYNDVNDVVYGITVSGRPAEIDGFETMLGLFINTIPLRVNWSDTTTVDDLVLSVRNSFYNVQSHQYLSLPEIQACSELKKDLLDHVFVFENYPFTSVAEESQQAGVAIAAADSFGQVNYDLAVLAYPGSNICLSFMHNSNKYPAAQINSIQGHLMQAIKAMIGAPDRLVAEIDILTDGERSELMSWSVQPGDFDKEKNIVDYFHEICHKFSGRKAIEDEAGSLSYGDLLQKVDRIAGVLLDSGIAPGDNIALLLSPGQEAIIAIMAVLKSSCAYVPVDIEYPAERISFMIANSDSKAVITSKEHVAVVSSVSIPVLCIEDMQATTTRDLPHISPDSLAYIIYTSGTTGQPKGCLLTHQNLVKIIKQKKDWISFNENDVWVLAHSYTFDFSVWEIFGCLLSGGKLIIPPRIKVKDVSEFSGLLKQKGVTVLNQTPLAFYQLIEQIDNGNDIAEYSIRLVIFGGEKLDFVKLLRWTEIDKNERVSLYNLYGITETTIHTTWHHVSHREIKSSHGRSVIGLPIPSTNVFVVNKQTQLSPVGVWGELLVGGEGVCSGYYKLNELTAQKFITDPVLGMGTVYRSGDIGRWLPDGTLEYSERRDNQVQIRGYRVEIGEILYWLQKTDGVKQAHIISAVLDGNTSLVAYVVADQALDAKAIRSYMKQYLPLHFIPQYFVFLDHLPLTHTGKVDVRKLPLPEKNIGTNSTAYTSVIEQKIIDIWEQELGCKVAVADDFFDLGGHSLKVMRIIGAVQKEFGITIPIFAIYEQPVLRDFAEFVKLAIGGGSDVVESDHILLRKDDAANVAFFLPPAIGYAFGFEPLARQLTSWKVFGLNFIENNTFEEMARVINYLQPEGPVVLCGFSASGSMCFHVSKILEAQGRVVKAVVLLDSRRFLQPEPLSADEVQRIVAEYMNDPRAQTYLTHSVLKESMRRRIEASITFIHQLQDDGVINADIYYIRSETNRGNDARVNDWKGITNGSVILHEGAGPHIAMLEEPYLQQNADVYKMIMDEIAQ